MSRIIVTRAGALLLTTGLLFAGFLATGPLTTDQAFAQASQPSTRLSEDSKTNGVEATEGDNGKFVDSADVPTYKLQDDGTADFFTWRGYKKYTANCMQCHGPDGQGSSFAPNLVESLHSIDYYKFTGIVVGGQQNVWHTGGNSIMPAWGEDKNVMCYLDAIYVYLRARSDGAVGNGEPKRPPINEEARKAENECLGF